MKTKSKEVQTVNGKYTFTSEEITEHTTKLLDVLTEKDTIAEEAKTAAGQFKNQIAGKDLEITSLRTALANGYEMRPYSCYVVKNFESGYREFFDVITENLIAKEALTSMDYQTRMDEDLEEIETKNRMAIVDGGSDQLGLVIEDKVKDANAEPSVFDLAADPEDEQEASEEAVADFREITGGDTAAISAKAETEQIPRSNTFLPPGEEEAKPSAEPDSEWPFDDPK